MKVAIITPDTTLAETMHLSFHFLLAHRLNGDTIEFYRRRSALGDFIILDNGAPEGALVRDELLIQTANAVNADEVILPDILRDMEGTIAASTSKKVLNAVLPPQRMIVPQGKDWDEWTACLKTLFRKCQPGTIGIPKWTNELPGGRVHALRILVKGGYHKRCHIHLLGMANAPRYEFMALNHAVVRSIDTALPIALAQVGITVGAGQMRTSMTWDMPFDGRIAERNIVDIIHLAQVIKCISL